MTGRKQLFKRDFTHKQPQNAQTRPADEGWQSISQWYDQCVGEQGHFYHREVILPRLQEHLDLSKATSILDLGCGQGILERLLPSSCRYLGVDASKHLLEAAKKRAQGSVHQFIQADLNQPQDFQETFDLAFFVLCLQNIKEGATAIKTAAKHLKPHGRLALVLNHPCFRIPRQSEWLEHPGRKSLMRCMHSYLSAQAIPIQTHPGRPGKTSEQSISYHHSLSVIFLWLEQAGLRVCHLEEWTCPKNSEGGKARMENRARAEFPLFLYIVASQ